MITRLFPRLAAATLFSVVTLSSAGAADESLDEMTKLLKMRLGSDDVEVPVETDIEGVYQTRFGNKFAYLIDGGRYVMIGDLIDLEQARNLTEASRRELVVSALADFGDEKLIVYPAAGKELAVLNVFTDTSCGYCQRLHGEVRFLQEAGISVHYYPYPRGGSRGPGYANMRKVWCADDKLAAMDIAKGVESGKLPGSADCDAAKYVDEGFVLGNQIGVSGTPSLFTADGTRFNGYVPYQELIPQLIGE